MLLSTYPFTDIFSREFKKGRTLRTDGFYFFDNGIDTLKILPKSENVVEETRAIFAAAGIEVPRHMKNKCDTNIVVLADGSTLLHFIAFSNNRKGMVAAANCRDKKLLDEVVQVLRRKDESSPEVDTLHDVSFINDSTFTFVVGESKVYNNKSLSQVEEGYYCTFRGSDHLIVRYRLKCMPGARMEERDYRFIPFNDVPADFGIKR